MLDDLLDPYSTRKKLYLTGETNTGRIRRAGH
jgi:hypothetical protein